jgi:fatty acid-binding protein DegV
VDTRTAASGQALVAEVASEAARDGSRSLADVVAAAQAAAARARVIGAVGTAEPLVAAGMVEIERGRGRPTIFEARQGAIEPLRVLDREDPVTALADLYGRQRGAGDPVAFTGAGAGRSGPAMAERLAGLVGSDRPPEVCSAAMTVYTGRGVIGIAWLDRA